MPTPNKARARTSAMVLTLAFAAALPACAAAGDQAVLSFGPDIVAPEPVRLVRAPLTGLMVEPAVAARPAVTVKIENSPPARPQGGLETADVVYELIVEGGVTRFLAVFHSTDADAGPIRSVRPGDPAVVTPFGGVVAFSGGIARFVAAMKAAPVVAVDETSGGGDIRRRGDRSAPHNLYSLTSALRGRAPSGTRAPAALADFLDEGADFAPANAVAVLGFDAVVGSTRVGYGWDRATGTWLRSTNGTPHVTESGTQVAPANVIFQFVDVVPTGEVDTSGSAVTESQVVGRGGAFIFSGGKAVAAQWSKPSASAMTTYTDAAGSRISLTPGQTWVEVAQLGASIVPRLPAPPVPAAP